MFFKKAVIISVLLCSLSFESFSQDQVDIYPHLYVGTNIGYQFESDIKIKSGDYYNKNSTYEFFVGSQFSKELSLDFGYEYHYSNDDNELSFLQSSLRYDWYFTNDWSIYFKGGIAYWMEDAYQKNTNTQASGFSPVGSLGVNYRLFPNVNIQVGYKFINNVGDSSLSNYDSNVIFLGATYHFKGEKVDFLSAVEALPFVDIKKEKVFKATDPVIISFDSESSTFEGDKEMNYLLERFVNVLIKYPQAKGRITGYTDSSGSSEYNQRLSLKRAQSVAQYLYKYGVSADQLIIEGAGEFQPIASNKTDEGRKKNRRVELNIRQFKYD